jgi:hypothetical protein
VGGNDRLVKRVLLDVVITRKGCTEIITLRGGSALNGEILVFHVLVQWSESLSNLEGEYVIKTYYVISEGQYPFQ